MMIKYSPFYSAHHLIEDRKSNKFLEIRHRCMSQFGHNQAVSSENSGTKVFRLGTFQFQINHQPSTA